MNNESLFQLSAQYQRIMDLVMGSDELSEEVMTELHNVHDSLEDKVLNYTSIIKTLEAKADAILKATEDMRKRAMSLINNAERMKEQIKTEMENCKLDKAANDYHEVTIRLNNPKVDENIDEKLLPSDYFKERMQRSIDKITILKDLKLGKDVPGARMIRETRLQIR